MRIGKNRNLKEQTNAVATLRQRTNAKHWGRQRSFSDASARSGERKLTLKGHGQQPKKGSTQFLTEINHF